MVLSPLIPGEPPNPRRPSMEAGIQGTGKLTFHTANWHGSHGQSREQVVKAERQFHRELLGVNYVKYAIFYL
jgi:hypothetical protein